MRYQLDLPYRGMMSAANFKQDRYISNRPTILIGEECQALNVRQPLRWLEKRRLGCQSSVSVTITLGFGRLAVIESAHVQGRRILYPNVRLSPNSE